MKSLACMTLAICTVLAGCASEERTTVASHSSKIQRCKHTTEHEIEALFDRWNASLQTGDPHKVVANYAEESILLPTVSNKPRLTPEEKEEYFEQFLKSQPFGSIDLRFVDIGCNYAVDAGLYTFTFGSTGEVVPARYSFSYRWDGSTWLITSHHSSVQPEPQ
jgi:uncharacterized protein (TIGR02246 family)